MNKALRQQNALKKICKIELFGANGSSTLSGNQSILFSKLTVSEDNCEWILLHQN